MRTISKEIEVVQRNDITLAKLEHFYIQDQNADKKILVYDGDEYRSVIDYNKLRMINTQRELDLFLDVDCCNEYLLNENDEEWADCIYEHTKTAILPVLSENGIQTLKQVNSQVDEDIYLESIHQLIQYFQQKDISVFGIRMPFVEEMTKNTHDFKYFPGDSLMWRNCNRALVEQILMYVTDKSYDEAKKNVSSCVSTEGKFFGSGERRIFLVGGCTVNGYAGFHGDELATILNDVLDGEYTIQCVSMVRFETTIKHKILEQDIRSNDLVILIDYGWGWCNSAIDIVSLFNGYAGDKWLYFDDPSHTTKYGNRLMAEAIADRIILPHFESVIGKKNAVIHRGSPRLSYKDEKRIVKYCEELSRFQKKGITGAIVMNCNPFTLGHRYLIEQALKEVDDLYLFVVEEEASEFTFQERFEMVKMGISDLKKIIVVPSGRFILSRESFRNYFEKDQMQGMVVDASRDLHIFADYIAKMLGITKRFVGEEPFDTVTKQYNEQMKEILGSVGIEVMEIPRKSLEGIVISASNVRKYLKENDWPLVQKLVPQAILEYLQLHKRNMKGEDSKRFDMYEKKMLQKIAEFIQKHDRVVLYGTGQNARNLLRYLPQEIIGKLAYCDKRAYTEEYEFMGVKVLSPPELSVMGMEVRILVSTTCYRYEVYDLLMSLGIKSKQIMFNPLCFVEI